MVFHHQSVYQKKRQISTVLAQFRHTAHDKRRKSSNLHIYGDDSPCRYPVVAGSMRIPSSPQKRGKEVLICFDRHSQNLGTLLAQECPIYWTASMVSVLLDTLYDCLVQRIDILFLLHGVAIRFYIYLFTMSEICAFSFYADTCGIIKQAGFVMPK